MQKSTQNIEVLLIALPQSNTSVITTQMKKQELANSSQKPPQDQISTPSFLSQRQLLFDFYDKHFLDFLYRFITLAYTSKIIVQFCLIFGVYVNKTIQHVCYTQTHIPFQPLFWLSIYPHHCLIFWCREGSSGLLSPLFLHSQILPLSHLTLYHMAGGKWLFFFFCTASLADLIM